MKIIIFYASYGGGHLNAAKSINECINETYPEVTVELIDCMKYVNKTVEKLTTAAYREMAKKAPWAWGRIYSDSQKGPLAHLSSRSNKIMAIKLLKLLREKNADLIISTHPFSSQMCSYLKRKGKINSKIATIMTDFAPHDQWLVGSYFTDYFFVANNKMKNYLINASIPENKIYVSGIPISNRFLKHYNKDEILKEFNLSDFCITNYEENNKILCEINLAPWNKLYKKDMLVKNKIEFSETLKYEDLSFVALSIKNSKKIGKINEQLNYYTIHKNSETTTRDKRVFDIFKQLDIVRNEYKSGKYLDELTVSVLLNYTIQQRYQIDKDTQSKFIDDAFKYLNDNNIDYKHSEYIKNRSFLKRLIEKNKFITKIYCKIYSMLKTR